MYHGFNNDDELQNELSRQGTITSKLRKKGICTHGWYQIGNKTNNIKGVICLNCGKAWKNEDEFKDEYNEIRETYF